MNNVYINNDLSRLTPIVDSTSQLLTVSTSVLQLDRELMDKRCVFVIMTADGDDLRYTANGDDPDAATGLIWKDGETKIFSKEAALLLKFIRITADVTLYATQWS